MASVPMASVAVTRPLDLATHDTTAFIAGQLAAGTSVLEVGCGAGDLAQALAQRGFRVRALDADEQSIAQARARGVDAQVCAWPDYTGASVDAVAFTRSLHHIAALDAALDRARAQLRPFGKLLLDDFAHEAADEPTLRWFAELLRTPAAQAQIAERPGSFVSELLIEMRSDRDPLAFWHARHGHHGVHPFGALTAAIGARFAITRIERVPYLYRYLVQVLPETAAAAQWLADVRRDEARRIQSGGLQALGRRLAAEVAAAA
jgi:SAM-dependent methyltransferase